MTSTPTSDEAPGRPTSRTRRPTSRSREMDRLQREADDARAQLAAAVDELTARLSPRNQATKVTAGARQLFKDALDSSADPAVRRRARLVLGVTAATTIVITAGIVRKIVR